MKYLGLLGQAHNKLMEDIELLDIVEMNDLEKVSVGELTLYFSVVL